MAIHLYVTLCPLNVTENGCKEGHFAKMVLSGPVDGLFPKIEHDIVYNLTVNQNVISRYGMQHG